MIPATTQDFSIVKTHVDTIMDHLALSDCPSAFYYFALDTILKLQESEIDDSITDSNYLMLSGKPAGHDRGIDALYIDNNTNPSTIHVFNCKYTDNFNKVNANFPSSEIDKILSFFNALMQQDENLENDVNAILFSKVEEIWSMFHNEVPQFEVHLCSNKAFPMEPNEDARLKRDLGKYSYITVNYHLIEDFISLLTRKDKIRVNARLRGHDKELFEKSDGDIRALLLNIDAQDLLRIVSSAEELRINVDIEDYGVVKTADILEDAFEDNVRIYLKQRSKINRNIKETALSDSRSRFFYFNNGVTLTCSRFSYSKNKFPIIDLENLQVVNGGQTIHALYDAFTDDSTDFNQIDLLCRIYETNDDVLSTNIAEYTNSQNPVKRRDIRSNDYIQKKLEIELKPLGYFYERKKNQFSDQPKTNRIDMEKTGQALMAFYNEMPSEAKDKKYLVFAEKYEDVFHDDINAQKVLLAVSLFDKLEAMKRDIRTTILEDPDKYENDSFILHASFYFLYTIKKLSLRDGIDLDSTDVDTMINYYTEAETHIRNAVLAEQESLNDYQEIYNHRIFFKGNRPKQYIDNEIRPRRE